MCYHYICLWLSKDHIRRIALHLDCSHVKKFKNATRCSLQLRRSSCYMLLLAFYSHVENSCLRGEVVANTTISTPIFIKVHLPSQTCKRSRICDIDFASDSLSYQERFSQCSIFHFVFNFIIINTRLTSPFKILKAQWQH